jgi:hypothetical protein
MPKETTYDQSGMYDVQVSWSREGQYVQIGVETHTKIPVAEALAAGGGDANSIDFTGLWGTFDAQGIDRVVAALQKAKRQTFEESPDED